MKTITIRLPDVEAAMLAKLKNRNSGFRDMDKAFAQMVRKAYLQL